MRFLSFTQIIATLGQFFTPLHVHIDDQRKRGVAALLLLILIPILIGFGVATLLKVGINAWVIMANNAALVSLLVLVALRYVRNMTVIFRLSQIVAISQLTIGLAIGSEQGAATLWFYMYPVTTFFLAGLREGALWVLISWVASVTVLGFNLGPYHYDLTLTTHFIAVYSIVCLVTYGLEASRQHYYTQLQAEKAHLEAALQQVKTLQGLLPICAACKKVRDDEGYWHQVESYLSRHLEVEFSHSICPECRTKLYPQLGKKVEKPAAVAEYTH